MRYIALLRGINVGGHQVKMERLRALFAELGLANVRTYIQTGNVFFDTDERDRDALTLAIEAHLLQSLGYVVPTFLRTTEELERTLALDPFQTLTVTDYMRLTIVFTASPIRPTLELPTWSAKRDMQIVAATAMDAFVVWYLINGRPPSGDKFIEKTLGSAVTSRFLHTTAKILEAAKAG
ncbi:MAG TPA: DUF1697 domain-containing protein [Ktedonobacterales bacterium]|jgi:uncharacterized protein (DUF1697 family)|nr:DUF1697 domain-containing protein [Ktedonobacterales bacterium]